MPYDFFEVPNASVATFPAQAELFAQDLQILAEGLHGNGVVSGCAVTQRAAGANMSVDVAAGSIVRELTTVAVAGGNAVVAAAHATLPRIDVVSVNNVGAVVVTTGTAATVPEPPTIPQVSNINNIVLAFLYVPAADAAINTNQIVDKRPLVNTPGGGGGGSGTVTHTVGALTADRLVIGNGAADIEVLGALGTATTVLHGNAAGAPTFGAVSLTADVTGDLPLANVAPATAASRLLGRGSAAGAGDYQEITLGANLTMTGTSLAASGGGGTTPTGTGFRHVAAGAEDAAAKLVDTADVNADQITYAKLQNVSAASKLLGRGAAGGAGDPEEITLGSGLTMTGTTLSAPTGGGGTVTTTGAPATGNLTQFSGAASITNGNLSGDVTTSGALAATIANDAVTYAKLQNVSAASKLLGRGDSGAGDPQEITLGANLSMAGTTLNASAASGAPTTADYLVRTADAGLSAERVVTDTATVTWDWSVAGQAKANAAGGGSSDVIAIVAADVVNPTNSLALTNITGLTFNTTASATELWQLEILLLTHCNASGTTQADFKFGWSVSGAQTIRWGGNPDTGVATAAVQLAAGTQATTLAYGSGGNVEGLIRLLAVVKSNGAAGAVQLRFAQNALATGAVVTIRADSFLIAKKVRS